MSSTEDVFPDTADMDLWDDSRILMEMLKGQQRAIMAVQAALPQIAHAARLAAERLQHGGRLVYAGAGSSIALGVLDGAELPGTFGFRRERILFLIAGGTGSLTDIDGLAEDDETAGAAAANALTKADTLITLSASGRTPYTLAVARAATAKGCLVIGIANTASAPLLALADAPILSPTGPEFIDGSTRLGAGTAQKVTLNLLSTLINIKLGATHAGLMVGLQASNAKLRNRARTVVAKITGLGEDQALAVLDAAGGDIKVAALMGLGAADRAAAESQLKAVHGRLRAAIDGLK